MPRTVVGRADFLDPAHIQESAHTVAIDPVIITEQEPGLSIIGHGFFELPDDPVHAWIPGDSEVKDLAPGVIEDHEDIEDFESQSRYRAEVNGPGFLEMIPDKGKPRL